MKIRLKNVRASFPHLFERQVGLDGGQGKYSIHGLLDDQSVVQVHSGDGWEQTTLEGIVKSVAEAAWKNKAGAMLKKFEDRQLFVRDGDKKSDGEKYTEYEGHQYVMAANAKSQPKVFERTGERVTSEEDSPIYPGCRVDLVLDAYANTKSGQMGVFAALLAVRFVADDESFGGGGGASADDFDFDEEDDVADVV
jgi:hypothetical protein